MGNPLVPCFSCLSSCSVGGERDAETFQLHSNSTLNKLGLKDGSEGLALHGSETSAGSQEHSVAAEEKIRAGNMPLAAAEEGGEASRLHTYQSSLASGTRESSIWTQSSAQPDKDEKEDNMSMLSILEEETCLSTMTFSDMPHYTIDPRLAEKARQSILYDRDDSFGRARQGDRRMSFADHIEHFGQIAARNEDEEGRKELQPGDNLDPNEIYFLSDCTGGLQKLGKGAFGTVYKGIWSGQTVAVKVCRERECSETSMQVFYKEISILRACRHPHIVQLKGACSWKEGKRTVLVTEYMEGGDLCNALGRWPELFSWEHGIGRRVAYEVAQGLAFLHANNIVHFDLKSGNVLLDRWNTAKVADVGLAKRLVHHHDGGALSTFVRTEELGTYAWAAPEVLVGAPCTTRADIFSFGVLLFELLTTELPEGRRLRPIRVPHEGPQEAADLVLACCLTNPNARPTADALVEILHLMQ